MADYVLLHRDQIQFMSISQLADFVITNADYSQKRVYIGGQEL